MRDRLTRDDVTPLPAHIKEYGTDAWRALKTLSVSVLMLLLGLVVIPVAYLWLPEGSAELRAARARARKEWMDADV